jgi:copper chaperone CopZ
MHLITGFILATLFGRKKGGDTSRLPSFPGVIETVHALPGRARFRVPEIIGYGSDATTLEKHLARLDGVDAVRVSPVSGSILVEFDANRVEPEMVMGAIIRLLGLEEQIDRAPHSRVGQEIRQAGDALNRAVHEQTRGIIDLYTGLPLLLVVLAVRNIATQNGQMGWPLLWWAYLALFPPGSNHR